MDIIHTDAPLMPLTQMVGETASVQVSTNSLGTKGDCFYGWVEERNSPACRPHHLVFTHDGVLMQTIAEALVAAGHQVVVTDFHTWSENQRVFAYDDDHQH